MESNVRFSVNQTTHVKPGHGTGSVNNITGNLGVHPIWRTHGEGDLLTCVHRVTTKNMTLTKDRKKLLINNSFNKILPSRDFKTSPQITFD